MACVLVVPSGFRGQFCRKGDPFVDLGELEFTANRSDLHSLLKTLINVVGPTAIGLSVEMFNYRREL